MRARTAHRPPQRAHELHVAPPGSAGQPVATSDTRCRAAVSQLTQRSRKSAIERPALSQHPTSPSARDLGVHPRGEFRTRERPQANQDHGPRQRPSLSNAEDCPSSEGGHQGLPATPSKCNAFGRYKVATTSRLAESNHPPGHKVDRWEGPRTSVENQEKRPPRGRFSFVRLLRGQLSSRHRRNQMAPAIIAAPASTPT